MTIGKSQRAALAMLIAVATVSPGTAVAQSTTTPGGTSPFTNTSGGAIANRRPGTWIQSGITTHSQRQSSALHAFGGATISETSPAPTFRDDVLPGLVQILLGALQALSTAIKTAVAAGTASTAT